MNKPLLQTAILCIFLSILFPVRIAAQNTRAFNQNASRSNHTRLSVSVSPVYSTPINSSSDSLLFRGNGAGFRFGADYYFGKAGIGLSAGFSSSSADDAVINNFLKKAGIPQDQLVINKSGQQNMYLLLGPSAGFGNQVELSAHAKGGMFINNGGLVNIYQRGSTKSIYRNETTAKSVYPGFITGMDVQYNTRNGAWSFGIGIDYMYSKVEVNNYDERRGGGIEALKLSRNISDVVVGLVIRHTIFSSREAGSGMATGRRSREAGSGMATGRRVLPTVNKREMNMTEPGMPGTATAQSCGPVYIKKTNPDGSTEEMTFACPDDAAAYAERRDNNGMPGRISMNTTVPRQTQQSSFGERTVSGVLGWTISSAGGNVSNAVISSSPRGGSVTMNTQNSSTRLSLKAREAGSGIATGRRQYEPMFIENSGNVCNPCLAEAKLSSVKNNPLYQSSGNSSNNPLYQGNRRTTGDEDCDGIAGAVIHLINTNDGNVVAQTMTGTCGDFYFSNLPGEDYTIKVTGTVTSKKMYTITVKSKTDLAGTVVQSDKVPRLLVSDGNEIVQKTLSTAGTGDPVHGVDVKLGFEGKLLRSASTNDNGEFELTGIEPGTYSLYVEHSFTIDDENGYQLKVQDHNSSRSNKSANSNMDRPGDEGGGNPMMKAQNNNTVRSNRTDNAFMDNSSNGDASATGNKGPVKWMAPEAMQKTINTSRGNIKDIQASLDELDQQLNTDKTNSAAAINSVRNNINSQRSAITEMRTTLDNLPYMEKEAAINRLKSDMDVLNRQHLALEGSIKGLGAQYTTISNVLKTKHDTAKNSISNIR